MWLRGYNIMIRVRFQAKLPNSSQNLKFKNLQPKTIEAYADAVRRMVCMSISVISSVEDPLLRLREARVLRTQVQF